MYIVDVKCFIKNMWASLVKNMPAIVRDMGPWIQEDALEKKMATHSSILSGNSHRQRSRVGDSPWGQEESDTTQ